MRFELARGPARSVPLTPLIDVVFLLLVFFMLASRFLELGSIGLDAADAGAPAAAADAIRVDLGADGRIEVGGAAVGRESLEATLRGLLRGRAEGAVVVAPEAAVPVDALVSLLDAVQRSGAGQVTLVRRPAAAGT
jgi:biopolymer transport protein ExbD